MLGIWGIVGYKILSVANPTLPDMAQQNRNVNFNPKIKTETDTFSVKMVNRDPFLGTLLIQKKASTKSLKPKTTIVWKPIIYHGIISNQNSKAKVFIVSIDNKQHLIKAGQTVNEVKLVRGNNKQVILSYKGHIKTIPKT